MLFFIDLVARQVEEETDEIEDVPFIEVEPKK